VSRYLILFILTAPFILAALLNTLVDYKMRKISRKKFWAQTILWVLILVGVASAEPIYSFLFSNNLTETEPLSLFDVIQISAIVMLLFISTRSRAKVELVERRLQDLHQELSIILSEKK
jgi:hypothetical protein